MYGLDTKLMSKTLGSLDPSTLADARRISGTVTVNPLAIYWGMQGHCPSVAIMSKRSRSGSTCTYRTLPIIFLPGQGLIFTVDLV